MGLFPTGLSDTDTEEHYFVGRSRKDPAHHRHSPIGVDQRPGLNDHAASHLRSRKPGELAVRGARIAADDRQHIGGSETHSANGLGKCAHQPHSSAGGEPVPILTRGRFQLQRF